MSNASQFLAQSPMLKQRLHYYFLNNPIDKEQFLMETKDLKVVIQSTEPTLQIYGSQTDLRLDTSNNLEELKAEVQFLRGENMNLKNEVQNLQEIIHELKPSQEEVFQKLNTDYNQLVKSQWGPVLKNMRQDLNVHYKNSYFHLKGQIQEFKVEIDEMKNAQLSKIKSLLTKNQERFNFCMDQLSSVVKEAFTRFTRRENSQTESSSEMYEKYAQQPSLQKNESFAHQPTIPTLDYTPQQFEILEKQYTDKEITNFLQQAGISAETQEDHLRYAIIKFFDLNESVYHQMIENYVYVRALTIFK